MPVLVFMDTGMSPTTPKPAPRPMDGIAVYLLIGNSQLVFCYPELYGGDGGGGGGGVHDTPCVLVLIFHLE